MTDRDRDVRERCAAICEALAKEYDADATRIKTGTIAAQRADQGSVTAIRLAMMIRALDLPLTSAPDEMRDHAAKAAFDAGWPMSNWHDRSQESSATFCIRIVNVALDVVLTSAREVTEAKAIQAVLASIDEQTYMARRKADYNLPEDAELALTFTMKEIRALEAALASAPQPACVGVGEERLAAIRKRLADATQDTGLRWAYESCGEKGDGSNVIGVMFHPDDQDAKNSLQGRCDPIYDEEAHEFRDYYRDEEVAEVEHRNRRSGAIAEFICHAPTDIADLLSALSPAPSPQAGGEWRPISEWTRNDGSHVLGLSEKWGAAEFMRHDDGWTVAAFNGQIHRDTPLFWKPLPSDDDARNLLASLSARREG